jgi:hypothetical protein
MECEFLVSKINFGFLSPAKGVPNLFWAVGSPKLGEKLSVKTPSSKNKN